MGKKSTLPKRIMGKNLRARRANSGTQRAGFEAWRANRRTQERKRHLDQIHDKQNEARLKMFKANILVDFMRKVFVDLHLDYPW